MSKFMRLVRDLRSEITGAYRITANVSSFLRYSADVCLFRLMSVGRLPRQNRLRQIQLRDGVSLTYRLNRGDIQSIREVWIDQVYRLPFDLEPKTIVDLGANIGMTSLWYAKKYRVTSLIAVEPSPGNVSLIRANFENNDVKAHVVEAAVGPSDGVTHFADDIQSHLGHISSSGRQVQMLSMPSLIKLLPDLATIDLVKMDIEGGEQDLLSGDLSWLAQVNALVAEFHPDRVDYPFLIEVIKKADFRYIPGGSVIADSVDAFIRD